MKNTKNCRYSVSKLSCHTPPKNCCDFINNFFILIFLFSSFTLFFAPSNFGRARMKNSCVHGHSVKEPFDFDLAPAPAPALQYCSPPFLAVKKFLLYRGLIYFKNITCALLCFSSTGTGIDLLFS